MIACYVLFSLAVAVTGKNTVSVNPELVKFPQNEYVRSKVNVT